DQRVDLCNRTIEGLAVGGVGPVELLAHPRALGALAGEEVGEPRACRGLAEGRARRALAPGESAKPRQQLRALAREQDGPVLQPGPARGQRVSKIDKRELGVLS